MTPEPQSGDEIGSVVAPGAGNGDGPSGVGDGPSGVGDGPPGLGAGSDDGLCDQFGAPAVVAAAEQVHEAPEAEPAAAALVFGARVDLARRYVAALATDGIVRGLIGPRESGRLWSRHVLNSAVVADLIEPDARIVDIGSGAGLPGIPLAIARPDCRVDLVEPLERRAQFLREMVELLELNHCRVVRGRAEDVVAECGGARVVTSRALAPLHRVAVWSAPLIAAGGWMVALKGQSAAEELARDRQALMATGLVDAELMTVGTGIVDPATLVVRAQRNGDMSKTPRAGQRRRPRKPQKDPMGQRSGRQGSQ